MSDTEEIERWFLERGTPHLIEGYSASRDVLTRAMPLLTLVFVVELFGALNADWRWWQNVLAAFGGFAFLIGVWGITNRLRGNPTFARPGRVGRTELAVFVLGPALVPLVFGGQVRQAVVVAVFNVVLLGLIFVVTSFGLVPLTRWALGKMIAELRSVTGLLGRALPLLLLIQVLLLFTNEVWQVAGGLNGAYLTFVLGLFVLIGFTFLLTRLPQELDRLASFDDAADLRRSCEHTPVADDAVKLFDGPVEPAPLSRTQRGNLLLVALFSQGVQVALVTLVLFAFFVGFGLITVTQTVLAGWLGYAADDIGRIDVLGRELVMTTELLKVSAFLAAFSGLYFAVYLVTDATYREEFFESLLVELRQTFAVRAVYLRRRQQT